MKRFLILLMGLCAAVTLCSCGSMGISYEQKSKKIIKDPSADKTTWSVYIYVCSDNGGRSTEAIKEMCSLNYTENVNFVLQTGGGTEWSEKGISTDYIQRYEMQKGAPFIADQKADASMGDYKTLAEFLQWGTEKYPADRNMLIIMGEGDGLTVVRDQKYGDDFLDVEEVYYAVSLSGKTFDIIGFDGGYMSSLEMAAALSPYGDYMVADEERGIGWDYGVLAKTITEYPYVTPEELSKIIVDGCYSKAQDSSWGKMINTTVIDLSRVAEVVQSFNAIAAQMYDRTDTIDELGALQRNLSTAARCVGTSQIDVGSLAQSVLNDVGEPASLMNDALNEAIVYRAAGDYRKNMSGISVFYPQEVNEELISRYMNYTTCDSYKKYIKSISPYIEAHDDYVTEDYNSSGAWEQYNGIPIGGTAYVDENSRFCFLVEPDLRALKDVHINRYMYYPDTDTYYSIGDNADIDCIWEAQTYIDNMTSKTLMIKNVPLDMHKEDEGSGYKILSSTIIINDVLSQLYIAYNEESGKYENLGVFRNGAYCKIRFGDSIAPVYRVYGNDTPLTGKTIKAGFFTKVKNKNLSDGTYIYEYEMHDVYNRSYKSGVCFMDKKGSAETLR